MRAAVLALEADEDAKDDQEANPYLSTFATGGGIEFEVVSGGGGAAPTQRSDHHPDGGAAARRAMDEGGDDKDDDDESDDASFGTGQ